MPFGQCCPNLGFHCFSNKIGIGMVLVLQTHMLHLITKSLFSNFLTFKNETQTLTVKDPYIGSILEGLK